VSQPVLFVCGLVAYDGTAYHGFQLQRGVPTIQGVLEAALLAATQSAVRVAGGGRTDTGVHARGQVIAIHAPWRHPVEALQRAWNFHLPKAIAVRRLQLAPSGFHPRFSALARTYRYTVYEASEAGNYSTPSYSPLTDRFALYVTRPLDLAVMRAAASYLVGEHNFATFGQPPQGENTVRRVDVADWQVAQSDLSSLGVYPGRRLIFTIRANGFLYQMVRNLVGALLEVGLGHWSPQQLQVALAACDRKYAAPPVPPNGLVLEQIQYPEHLGLQFD
jgi:tRNA pseudouridine38-40 synthase